MKLFLLFFCWVGNRTKGLLKIYRLLISKEPWLEAIDCPWKNAAVWKGLTLKPAKKPNGNCQVLDHPSESIRIRPQSTMKKLLKVNGSTAVHVQYLQAEKKKKTAQRVCQKASGLVEKSTVETLICLLCFREFTQKHEFAKRLPEAQGNNHFYQAPLKGESSFQESSRHDAGEMLGCAQFGTGKNTCATQFENAPPPSDSGKYRVYTNPQVPEPKINKNKNQK